MALTLVPEQETVAETSPLDLDQSPDLTEEEWEENLRVLARDLDRGQWEIADAIIEANARWGEKYTRAAEITGKAKSTLENWVSVAKKFESSRRREDSLHLRFGHFEAVASLTEPALQNKLLTEADKKKLSVDGLRERARAFRQQTGDSDHDPADRVVVMVPRERYSAFIDAADARDKPEAEMKKAVGKWLLDLGVQATNNQSGQTGGSA